MLERLELRSSVVPCMRPHRGCDAAPFRRSQTAPPAIFFSHVISNSCNPHRRACVFNTSRPLRETKVERLRFGPQQGSIQATCFAAISATRFTSKRSRPFSCRLLYKASTSVTGLLLLITEVKHTSIRPFINPFLHAQNLCFRVILINQLQSQTFPSFPRRPPYRASTSSVRRCSCWPK